MRETIVTTTTKRPKGPLVIAIGLGAATSLGLTFYLRALQQDQAADALVPLVVAARPVAAEAKIGADDLMVRQVPQRLVPAAGLKQTTAAVDRISRIPLFPGDPVLEPKLYPLGSDGGMTFTIPKGKRAVTVAVDEVTGVAGFIKPGHRVDVIGARPDHGDGAGKAQTVVQNLTVLAVAQDREDTNGRKARLVSSVTLLASPTEAEKLTLASEQGKIRLALRASGDMAVVKAPPPPPPQRRIVQVAVARPAPPVRSVPVQKPAAPVRQPGIEVIRGAHRDVTGGQ
jgi:pilus assembly protein CpaB